ncbi:hypothetical protein IWW37_001688 [Coemansia sp. RSA 2050]|nr:hypothetical protein IWW37_001688 [Coemansia sp. RSA 2050]KAJ2735402.1 hypothetical protein IW152_001628 [Coemansia sp. BCRC 34962]
MDTATRFSLTGLLTFTFLLVLTIWTWLAAIPRLILGLILRVLDVFESTMLLVVWEYQGDNILKFLFKHHYIQSGTAVVCAHPVASPNLHSKSQSIQTGDSIDAVLAHKQIQALDKLANDLIPSLLCALDELPQRGALGCHAEYQANEQNQRLLPTSAESELELQAVCPSRELHTIEARLQVMVDKIGNVDTRLARLQCAISEAPLPIIASCTARHDDILTSVIDGLNALKAKCGFDRMLALQLVQSLATLDATLANIELSPLGTGRQVADVIIQTDDHAQNVSRNDSMFTELAETHVATPIHNGTEQPEVMYSSSSSISTDDAAAADDDSASDAEASTSDSDQCSVRSLKSLKMYTNAEKMTPLVATSDVVPGIITQGPPATAHLAVQPEYGRSEVSPPTKTYRFSIRRGIRRYSWFGKKAQTSQVQD